MLSAPYGVFALLAAIIVEAPSMDLFKALGLYSLTVLFGLFFIDMHIYYNCQVIYW